MFNGAGFSWFATIDFGNHHPGESRIQCLCGSLGMKITAPGIDLVVGRRFNGWVVQIPWNLPNATSVYYLIFAGQVVLPTQGRPPLNAGQRVNPGAWTLLHGLLIQDTYGRNG
jgi:hypothetical protein